MSLKNAKNMDKYPWKDIHVRGNKFGISDTPNHRISVGACFSPGDHLSSFYLPSDVGGLFCVECLNDGSEALRAHSETNSDQRLPRCPISYLI